MRPSESEVGRAWIANFHETEAPAAAVLLDHLRLVPLRRLREGILQLLRALDVSDRRPFVVYPERALTTFEGLGGPLVPQPEAWTDFAPGAPIRISEAGSDAFVAMVLGELSTPDGLPIGGIETSSTLDDLRARRCRTIVIATDIVASGHQAEDLAFAIARHPTIRSWRSYGLLTIHVVAFAALQRGVDHLTKSPVVDAIDYLELAPTVSSIPDPIQRDAVFSLCRRYGGPEPLGYAGTAALFATERRAPDNVPAVLLREGTASWAPLFPNRVVPHGLAAEIGDHRSAEPLEAAAKRLGQLRLGRNERVESIRRESRDLIQVLTLAAAAPVTPAAIATSLGRDIPVAEALLSSLQSWDLVDGSGATTAAGRLELAEYKRGLRRTSAGLHGSDEPYYHRGVR